MKAPLSLPCIGLCLTLSVATEVVCQPIPVTEEDAITLTGVMDNMQNLKTKFWEAAGENDRRGVAHAAEELAYASLESKAYGYGYICRASAALLKHCGERDRAALLLTAVSHDPETPHDCVSALRQLGQLHESRQQWMDALGTYRRAVTFALANPEGAIERDSGSFGVCANGLGAMATMVRDQDLAEFAYRSIIDYPGSAIERNAVLTAFHGLLAFYRNNNQTDSLLPLHEELFQRFPRFGLENDDGVGTRVGYYDLKHPDRVSDEYLNAVLDIWLGNTLASPESVFLLGDRLASSYSARRDRANAYAMHVETCRRLRDLECPDDRIALRRDKALLSSLLRLIDSASMPGGDPDQAQAALLEADELSLKVHGRRFDPMSFDAYTRAIDRGR